MAEYLLVTGMSGAGRSSAAATIEDLGWFVMDNLPSELIVRVAELSSVRGTELERFCFIAGRGGPESVNELAPAIAQLRSTGARVRVVFLDCSDEVLVRRFEGTRRCHPFDTGGGVLEAIRTERTLTESLRGEADVIIDTSETNVHELRDRLTEMISPTRDVESMETTIVSFGFKHGLPIDTDLVMDCRFLPNPHWVESLRPLNGLDPKVRDYVLTSDQAVAFLDHLEELFAFLLPLYAREGKSYLSIAIGCTGGQHRSVVIAEELTSRLSHHGFSPKVHHRDIDR